MKYELAIATLSLGALTGCVTFDERKMYCYKFGDCSETSPVTSKIVKVSYGVDHNGQNNSIYLKDRFTGNKYRLMRNSKGNKLELEVVSAEFEN